MMGPSILLLLELALGQSAPTDAEAEARARFDSAEIAYDLAQFDKAIKLYSEAYELKALPAFLFNIGQCYRQLHQWERAAFFFRRFTLRDEKGAEAANVDRLV